MRIRVLGSAVGASDTCQYTASYIVNETIAIDAGCIGFLNPIEHQKRIERVFLSHSHLDHIASLPIFLDNVYQPNGNCPTVCASADTLDALQKHFFNDVIWPDFIQLSTEQTPFLKTETLVVGKAVAIDKLTITPIAIDHLVPTVAFVIEDAQATVAIVSDTLPTEEIWNVINSKKNLKGVFLEASFPNSMRVLADTSNHLTTDGFAGEVRKLQTVVPICAVHIKAAFYDSVVQEIEALGLSNVQISQPGKEYVFGDEQNGVCLPRSQSTQLPAN